MSESDTFLDSLLEGVIGADAPPLVPERSAAPQAPTPGLGALPPMFAPGGATTTSPRPSNIADDFEPEPSPSLVEPPQSVAEPAEAAVRSGAFPFAAPHEILGLPGQPDISASHIELALEINDVAETAPQAEGTTTSYAAIAREIAATVEVGSPRSTSSQAEMDQKEVDHSSMYLRTRGHRRRRVKHSTLVTVTQVFGIVLLLVVGLAAEYEYVAKGHASSTASSPTVTTLPATRLPAVAPTPLKGSLFHFARSGSAQSATFRVAAPFFVTLSTRCSAVAKPTSVDVVLQSQERQAANLFVAVKAAGIHEARSQALRAGSYLLIVRAPGVCTWSAQGFARP